MTIIFIFIFGLAIGSFLNVIIDRLPANQSIGGRSHCDNCKKQLAWHDLIPVLSWVWLVGRCRYCKKKISVYYPLVELVTGLSFLLFWKLVTLEYGIIPHPVGLPIHSVLLPLLSGIGSEDVGILFLTGLVIIFIIKALFLGIISSLIVIFFADIKYHIIPDEATLGLLLFSVPLVLVSGRWQEHILTGLLLLLIIYFLFIITKRKGMGFGDVKLAGAMGFMLGLVPGLMALYLAFIMGGLISLFLIVARTRGLKSKIAFGPFLVIGTVLMLFFPQTILLTVKDLFGF